MRVGLSWDREDLAQAFLSKVNQLTARPDNLGLSGPRKEKEVSRGEKEAGRRSRRQLDKSQISSPCGFRHTVAVRMSLSKTHSILTSSIWRPWCTSLFWVHHPMPAVLCPPQNIAGI